VDAVLRAGGVPVLLPPVGTGQAELLHRLDGLILSGGADVVPARYGRPIHPETIGTRPERDSFEFRLARAALAVSLPVLGICRGLQVLNVVLGGTLTQHLPDVVGHAGHRPELGVYGANRIGIGAGSKMAGILGGWVSVRCHHHQAIDRLADGLLAVGHAEDGTIEAIETRGEEFVLGVQWHPEEAHDDDRLFAALTDAASSKQNTTRDGTQRIGQNAAAS
jgi:gamma-glutamyl-gamma-aminobutyrate hydrolase PuuD